MRRHATLALCVWIAAIAMIVLFTVFWRVGNVRPHVLWGILSLLAVFIPLVWLAASALWRFVRGPARLRALGWLLVGATPVIWSGAYITSLLVEMHSGALGAAITPVRIIGVCASPVFDIEAWWRYPSWTRGRHAMLIDDGSSPSPERLVADMDRHIEKMADLLGQPIPDKEFPWVRGSLFGFSGRAIYLWAICGRSDRENPACLASVDRHEVAHTLITAMCGSDQDPPAVLTEGWAESQSRNRDDQIRGLAKARREGRAYSLQDLVGLAGYGQVSAASCAYWEGGPLVHYLMHRYGPKNFFRLYAGVRRASFHEDCQAILGDSWETVEEGFWKWIEAEDKLLSRDHRNPPVKEPLLDVELDKSVNPADWQALLEGCREASKDLKPMPSNAAFSIKGTRTGGKPETEAADNRKDYEFSAVFEDQEFWIFDNFFRIGGDSFLMATSARNADLMRDKSGVLHGEVTNAWPRNGAADLVAFYRDEGSPARLLPLQEGSGNYGTWRIGRLIRPVEGSTAKWNVWFTRRYAKDQPEVPYQIEVDPAQRWRTTRVVLDRKGEFRSETDLQCQYLGDAFLPATLHARYAGKDGETTVHWQGHAMSDAERRQFKQRVEQAADEWKRTDPRPWLTRGLWAIVIVPPLGGATLLIFAPRCKPAQVAP